MANVLGTIATNALIGLAAFFLCLATMWQFVWYLSSHDHAHFYSALWPYRDYYFLSLLVDACLVLLFVGQHSFMAKNFLKKLFEFHGEVEVLHRTTYTITTCLALQLLMRYWRPVHAVVLWEINTSNSATWWWTFSSVHWLLWFVIYGGVLIMDVGELVGIKQVYYNAVGLPDPLLSKSKNLRRLYNHMRHPSLTALAAILWFHPVMRLDRTLLAAALVAYMIVRFRVDERDHLYHRHQLRRKAHELKSP